MKGTRALRVDGLSLQRSWLLSSGCSEVELTLPSFLRSAEASVRDASVCALAYLPVCLHMPLHGAPSREQLRGRG